VSAIAVLSREECLFHLGNATWARVLVSVKSLPAALLTRVRIVDAHLHLATDNPSILAAARRHDVFSVQADGLAADGSTWSVTVSGIGDLLMEAPLPALVRLPLAIVSGQRLV
jgi:hypothetical protein